VPIPPLNKFRGILGTRFMTNIQARGSGLRERVILDSINDDSIEFTFQIFDSNDRIVVDIEEAFKLAQYIFQTNNRYLYKKFPSKREEGY
jgi:hypothetical protein